MSESFAERAARLRERVAAQEAAKAPTHATHEPDLIPDVTGDSTYQPTELDQEIDRRVDEIDILDIYRRYVGKMDPDPRGRRESIMISCPRADHHDADPSAWVNLDDQLWYCGGEQEGGDKYDMIAVARGDYNRTYQQGKNFPELKREIYEDFFGPLPELRRTPGGETYLVPVTEDEGVESSPDASSSSSTNTPSSTDPEDADPSASVTVLYPTEDDGPDDDSAQAEVEQAIPVIPWKKIFPVNTFMYEYIKAVDEDDLPTEYHIFNGLGLVGLAVAKRALLADGAAPVYPNLFSCLFGPSGMGKSRSMRPMISTAREALPFDRNDDSNQGCMVAPMAGSPEALIDLFAWDLYDPADPKKVIGQKPVTGLVRYDELSGLVGRSNRVGNPLKPTLMEFYDTYHEVSTSSRGHGTVKATEPFATLVTSTQPRAIRSVLLNSDVDSGFVNRFIFVMGHAKRSIPFGAEAPDMTAAIKQLQQLHAWSLLSSSGRRIKMSDAALERFNEFYWEQLEQFKMSDDSIMSRIPLQMKKLLLLIVLNEKLSEVEVEHVEKMILFFPYIQATYAYLSGDLGTGERQEYDNAVLEAVRAFQDTTGRGATPRDIMARLARRFDRSASAVRRALDDLCAVGLLNETHIKPKVGRPTTRYEVAS